MYPILFHGCGVPSDAFWVTVCLGFRVARLVVRTELRRQGHDGGAGAVAWRARCQLAAPLRTAQGV